MKLMNHLKALACAALALCAAPAWANNDICGPYEMIGEGPDILLVPGLASSPATWDGIAEELSRTHRVHLVHIAGFAGRAPTDDPENVLKNARAEMLAYLDCRGIAQADYVGHSLGGFSGLLFAHENPSRIGKLVIVDSLPFFPLIFNPAATADSVGMQAAAMRDGILAQSDDAFRAQQAASARSLVQSAEDQAMLVEWSMESDRATVGAALYGLMTTDARSLLQEVTTPVTLIVPHNTFAPLARVEPLYRGAYAGLANVKFRFVGDAYHFVMLDQPEAFERELKAALGIAG